MIGGDCCRLIGGLLTPCFLISYHCVCVCVCHQIHPVVRTHPETSRKALYVNELFTKSIEGLPQEEGRQLLRTLWDHSTQDKFIYTHKWQENDIVFWVS